MLNFNKNLYTAKAIKQSIELYRDLAVFGITEDKDYYKVSLKEIDLEVKDIIMDEFANQVLFLTKQV